MSREIERIRPIRRGDPEPGWEIRYVGKDWWLGVLLGEHPVIDLLIARAERVPLALYGDDGIAVSDLPELATIRVDNVRDAWCLATMAAGTVARRLRDGRPVSDVEPQLVQLRDVLRRIDVLTAETIKQRLIAFLRRPVNSEGLWREWGEVVDELLAGGDASTLEAATPSPIPMVLACPTCHAWHVDEGEWATRPHKTHLCSRCGALFRPANVPTVGVVALSVEERIAAEVRSSATVDSGDRRQALRAEQIAGLKSKA